MSQSLCKLCLFKSEPIDEIFIEESLCLQQIIDEIFCNKIQLTKLDLDGICTLCREKLKSFHEYYKFVLENQKIQLELASEVLPSEFVEVIKEECTPTRKKQRGKSKTQQMQFIGLLFELKCKDCPTERFSTYKEVFNHYRSSHKAKLKCCKKQMTRDIELIEHVIEHKGIWKCDDCTAEFTASIELWKHLNEVHRKTPYEDPYNWLKLEYACDLCSSRFRTRAAMSRHMKDIHIKNFNCPICHAAFYHKRDATQHQTREHADVPKIPCQICGVMIKNSPHLMTAHIKNIHENQSMICPQCGKVCRSDRSYRGHMIRNHQPPKHKCSFCPKRFKSALYLKDHEAIHTKTPRWTCTICSAQFKSHGNFSAHKKKLHPLEFQKQKIEREVRKYQI